MGKTGAPKAYRKDAEGMVTYRLETNKELYEGVRSQPRPRRPALALPCLLALPPASIHRITRDHSETAMLAEADLRQPCLPRPTSDSHAYRG